MKLIQHPDQIIDIADWRRDEEFAEYPEGARDKTLVYCSDSGFNFLKAGHRYLFKLSNPRYIEQFWVEIFAYRLGMEMDVPVPPAFVAHDSKQNQSGALIEWFLSNEKSNENFIPGGDYCQQYIPSFNRKKGRQHNFETVSQIFEVKLNEEDSKFKLDWKNYWAKALLFDALIGNTDRHQDNWGILKLLTYGNEKISSQMRIAPVFDNGTSMGHEIFANKFHLFEDYKYTENYVLKGTHHIKWSLSDETRGHAELLKKLAEKYPETRAIMLSCLKMVDSNSFRNILDDLAGFHVPVILTPERAAFMLRLLQFRRQYLLNELEK